jgi:hypothetical protein
VIRPVMRRRLPTVPNEERETVVTVAAETMAASMSRRPACRETRAGLERWADLIVLDIYGSLEKTGRISGRLVYTPRRAARGRPWTAQDVTAVLRLDPLRRHLSEMVASTAGGVSTQETPEVLATIADLASAGADAVRIARGLRRMKLAVIPYSTRRGASGRLVSSNGGTTTALVANSASGKSYRKMASLASCPSSASSP